MGLLYHSLVGALAYTFSHYISTGYTLIFQPKGAYISGQSGTYTLRDTIIPPVRS